MPRDRCGPASRASPAPTTVLEPVRDPALTVPEIATPITPAGRLDEDAVGWDRMQRDYWDQVAPGYPRLYRDGWSRRENENVVARLRANLPTTTSTVLDLGCGSGLGASLVAQALDHEPAYYGIDISLAMLERCQRAVPGAELRQGPMTDLEPLAGAAFDAVTAFYAAGSYASSLERLLDAASAVLAVDGILYLSVVNRWSLRRLARGRLARLERYHTRREHDATPPLIHVYSRSELRAAIARRPELVLLALEGQGALAGLAEHERLWPLSATLDQLAPDCSHLLELVLRKQPTT